MSGPKGYATPPSGLMLAPCLTTCNHNGCRPMTLWSVLPRAGSSGWWRSSRGLSRRIFTSSDGAERATNARAVINRYPWPMDSTIFLDVAG